MRHGRLAALFRPCPGWLALGLALAIGAAHTLAMLPMGVILGTAEFWTFPRGIVAGGQVDMAQELMGYRYLAQAPWMLPLLHVPNITPPDGMNAFWLDPVPWLGLLTRPVEALAGHLVNLLGFFLFAAFALPGVAMAALLRAAGERGLLAAAAAALLCDPMPLLLIEWGHIALCLQAAVIAALALYVAERRRAGWHNDWREGRAHPWAWFFLLALTLLTHLYLFVMVGGIWAAATLENLLERRRWTAPRALATLAAIVALGFATGILSPRTLSGGTTGFGIGSMNLASPILPQLSGAIPPLREYWAGMHIQVFDYPGLGVLLLLLAALATRLRHGRDSRSGPWRRHGALLALLLGFLLFALSNRVTLGARVLLELPLPDKLAYALGAFRASGRFFWPLAYALTASGLLVLLRQARRGVALVLLAGLGAVQVVDAGPLRQAIAASIAHPPAPVFDHARAMALLDHATEMLVFPSVGCVAQAVEHGPVASWLATETKLDQANVELQLLAARRNLPLNTVVNSRLPTDCAAEAAMRAAPLRPGVAYVYLDGTAPAAAECMAIDWLRACRLPEQGRD